ncbi:MAG: hypothetical protein ACTHOK_18415 [Nocardioidaceae bacterium]
MARLRSRVAVVSALGMIAAGAMTTATTTAADAATAAPTIKVFITKTRAVRMTTHMHPGVHRFVIRSGKGAAFQLLHARPGYTKRELSRDVNAGLNSNDKPNVKALKRFERNVTLYGGAPSRPGDRGVLFVDLPAGTYWVADTNAHVQKAGKILTIHVGGRRVAGRMPHARTVRAINEATWAKRPRTIPSSGLLGFRNDSTDNHFIASARLLPGKTVKDFGKWVDAVRNNDPNAGPPPVDENGPSIDSGVISPGRSMTMRYHVPPGHYVMVCFWPDSEMGGMPHVFMGMYRGLTVR